MDDCRIIGVVLIKNEDLYIERVLQNILSFCDEIFVADHLSSDRTATIVKKLALKHPQIHYHSIDNPSQSHTLIEKFAGKKNWIFGVDGDEIYDPHGLKKFKTKILSGEFDHQWVVFGNVLNCIELDEGNNIARGYLAPPCRSMTKLYNFNAIISWSGPCPERLHGGEILFRRNFDKKKRLDLYKTISWDESLFRCLHLCFMRRSSLEENKGNRRVIRKNISDKLSENILKKILSLMVNRLGLLQYSSYKREKYMRGHLVEKKVTNFCRHFDSEG